MKRKNIFILIGVSVVLLLIFLIWWLSNSYKSINKKHLGLTFQIHNCSAVEQNRELLRSNFLKPLLRSSMIEEKDGLQKLFIPEVLSSNYQFSIPSSGINSFRYNAEADELRLSTMTFDARKEDESTFFSNWNADGFQNLENDLLQGNPKYKKNEDLPNLGTIMKQDASDKIIQDSIIIDNNCRTEKAPFLFQSTENARKYIDGILAKNPNAIKNGTLKGTIHLFFFCDQGYNFDPNDRDSDGVLNEQDDCPDLFGEKDNNGCPVKEIKKEKDLTSVITPQPAERNNLSNVCLGSDRKLTWNGDSDNLKIKISIPTLGVSIIKTVQKNHKIELSNEEKKQLIQIDNPNTDKISIDFLNYQTKKYSSVKVVGSNGIIHCYNIF
jgi:hypothetical protein